MSRLTLILDSTQINDFYSCPMFWNLYHRQGLIPIKDTIESKYRDAGSFAHLMLEHYYNNIHIGVREACQAARAVQNTYSTVDAALEKLIRDRFEQYWMKWMVLKDIEPLTQKIHKIEIGTNGLPVDIYEEQPIVEKGFSYCLLDNANYLFVLEGKLDVLGTYSGVRAFMDHKFQFREHNLYDKRIQFRNYALGTECSTGIVNYIRFHQKLQDNTLVRDVTTIMKDETRWWKSELIKKYTEIAHAIENDSFLNNWGSCEGRYGSPCIFTSNKRTARMGICDNQGNPSMLHFIKQANYTTKSETWSPW